MKGRKYFRFLGILTMVLIFIPFVSSRIPIPDIPFVPDYVKFSSIMLVIWVFSLLLSYPNVIFSRYTAGIYLYISVVVIGLLLWADNFKLEGNEGISILGMVSLDMPWVLLGILMMSYFLLQKDYFGYAMVIGAGLLSILFTEITSIIILNLFPRAARDVVRGAEFDGLEQVKSLGMTSFSTLYGLCIIMPVIVYEIKRSKLFKKSLLWAFVGLSVYVIYLSQQTTALLVGVISLIIALFYSKYRTIPIIIIALPLLLFYDQIITSLLDISLGFISPDSDVYVRLSDLGSATSGKIDFDDSYFAEARGSRIEGSLSSFLSNPLIGGGHSYMHSYWIDRLALFGILGAIPWVIIWRRFIKLQKSILSEEYYPYFLMGVLLIFIIGILKGISGSEIWIMTFFFLPGMSLFYQQIFNKTGSR